MNKKITYWKEQIVKFTDMALDMLYPKTCPVCDNVLKRQEMICSQCRGKLVYICEPRCKKCGKFLGKEENASYQEYCSDCRRVRHSYDFGIAVFILNDEMRQSIYRFKYKNRRTYAIFYGNAIADYCGTLFLTLGIEVIVPVPIHKRKKRQRGFNQTDLIAEALGERLHLPVCSNLLVRTRYTIPQKELNPTARHNNVKNAFQIGKSLVQYKKILLVDDIYTTGSTIDACAEMLKTAGVEQIYFVSLAIGASM